jgi:hypothetical protein
MALHKGRLLLEALLTELLEFAEVTLAGCFDFPDRFVSNPRIRVIPSYDRDGLCRIVQEIRPDVGLLLSIFPETFSYTLHELQSMGVPPVATRIGSFEDWIKDSETGFLADPQPEPLLNLLRSLARNKSRLQEVHRTLGHLTFRSPEEMVRDYRELSETRYSARRYFAGPAAPPPVRDRGLQLYWRTSEEGFSEQHSALAFPRGSSRQTLRLDFATPGIAPAELRLDLATRPGFVLLHRISLLGRKEETLWTLDGTREAFLNAQMIQCFIANEPEESGEGLLLCLFGDDPHIILPVPSAALTDTKGAGTLEVDFAPEPDFESLFECLPEQRNDALLAQQFRIEELGKALLRAQAKTAEAEQRVEHARAELRQREQVIQGLQQSVSWRITKPLRTLSHAGRRDKNQDGEDPR